MEYHKIHLTHVLVSGEWVLALITFFYLVGLYHIPLNLWTFMSVLGFSAPNGYFLSKWAITDTGITEATNK